MLNRNEKTTNYLLLFPPVFIIRITYIYMVSSSHFCLLLNQSKLVKGSLLPQYSDIARILYRDPLWFDEVKCLQLKTIGSMYTC